MYLINIGGDIFVGDRVQDGSVVRDISCSINENMNTYLFTVYFILDSGKRSEKFVCSAPGGHKVQLSIGDSIAKTVLSKIIEYVSAPAAEIYCESIHTMLAEHVVSYYKELENENT